MLVNELEHILVGMGKPPPFHIVRRGSMEGACRAAYLYVGIAFLDGTSYHQAALLKHGRDDVFIAYADIFQVERFGMPRLGTHGSPFVGGGVAIGPFYHIAQFVDIGWHLFHGYSTLLSAKALGIAR